MRTSDKPRNSGRSRLIIHSINSGQSYTSVPKAGADASNCLMPIHRIGTAAINPANGPASPTSKISLRFARRPSIPITAPIVPIGVMNGNGIKIGRLAGIRYRTVAKKWPSSWNQKNHKDARHVHQPLVPVT